MPHKSSSRVKEVSISVLESRLNPAVRPKDRLWAMIRLAEGLTGKATVKTERALQLLTEAELLATVIPNRRGIAAAIRGIAICQLYLSNPETALQSLERALPIAEETGDAECEIKILRDMGNVYSRQDRHDLALATLQKCAELAELIGNTSVQASALNRMGGLLTHVGRYHDAIECHTKCLALFEHMDTARDEAITLLSLSNALQPLGKYAEALSVLGRACGLCQAARDYHTEAFCQGALGAIYSDIGDYPNALSSLIASVAIFKRTGDKLNLANSYTNFTQVYLHLGNAEHAKEFGEKALAIFKEIGDKRGQAAMYGNLGEHYLERGNKDKALHLFKECLALSREVGSKSYEASALTFLARLEMNLGEFTTAEKLYRDSLRIANESGERERTAHALLGLGALYCKQNKPDKSLPILEQAVVVAKEINSPRYEQESHQMLSEALEANGDLKRAIEHSKLASKIKEEILGIEKQRAVNELQIRLDIEKSETETNLLRKETESKSQEVERMVMKLAEKNELVRSVSRRIREIVKTWNDNKRSRFDELLSEIERDYATQGKRTIFNEFQVIHRDILQKLLHRYPTLTSTERKICILLISGLSTKQMALMLKVSPHAIEMKRWAIRKKMKLERRTNLATVLMRIV